MDTSCSEKQREDIGSPAAKPRKKVQKARELVSKSPKWENRYCHS